MKIKDMNQNNIKPQELLTGKAKEAFLSYVYEQGLEDLLIRDISLNAIIIDWLDSVGIITEVVATYYDGWTFLPVVYDPSGNKHDIDVDFETRHHATQEAIKKAVEIYNKGAM